MSQKKPRQHALTHVLSIHTHHTMCLPRDCIRAPPRGGRDWKIHPRRPRFPETREISRGRSQREISRVEGNLERFPAAMGFAPRDPRVEGAKPMAKGNFEGGGDGFSNPSRVLVEHGHSLIITREGPHWFSSLFNENQ